jgi:hypothetical protein
MISRNSTGVALIPTGPVTAADAIVPDTDSADASPANASKIENRSNVLLIAFTHCW